MATPPASPAWQHHPDLAGTPDAPAGAVCYNCDTALQGGWCHACGQAAHDYHHKATYLAGEALGDFFHADGRLWRTLRRLAGTPARLTRDYLAGKRAPQIPPLRLFLVAVLVLFLVGNWATRDAALFHSRMPPPEAQADLKASNIRLGLPPAMDRAASAWLRDHLGRALAHPDDLVDAMRGRAEDFAFMMLPISALILAAIFAFRRGFVLFDHLVFSMHSLAFQGFLISLAVLAGSAWLLWAAPIHLFAHLRGVYGTTVVGTLMRMAILFVASAIAFALLVLGLVVVGLQGLRPVV